MVVLGGWGVPGARILFRLRTSLTRLICEKFNFRRLTELESDHFAEEICETAQLKGPLSPLGGTYVKFKVKRLLDSCHLRGMDVQLEIQPLGGYASDSGSLFEAGISSTACGVLCR